MNRASSIMLSQKIMKGGVGVSGGEIVTNVWKCMGERRGSMVMNGVWQYYTINTNCQYNCNYNSIGGVRMYRGEAKEGTSQLSDEELVLYHKAKPKSDDILMNHRKLPDLTKIPVASLYDPREIPESLISTGTITEAGETTNVTLPKMMTSDDDLTIEIRRKRLLYRSKQRGWLEVDLLLGTWAAKYIPQLTPSELDEYEAFVNYETIDIYNIVTNRLDVPDHLKTPDGNGIVERIQAWAMTSPLGQADPDMYKFVKGNSNLI